MELETGTGSFKHKRSKNKDGDVLHLQGGEGGPTPAPGRQETAGVGLTRQDCLERLMSPL